MENKYKYTVYILGSQEMHAIGRFIKTRDICININIYTTEIYTLYISRHNEKRLGFCRQ